MQFLQYTLPSPQYTAACHLRNDLLRRPLGRDLFAEDLTQETAARHFGMFVEQRLIATVMIVPQSPGQVLLRQMCVATEFQGQGVGRKLLECVERELQNSGVRCISLAARVSAIPFYEKQGYARVSAEFLSVGIPHMTMQKCLDS